MLLRSTGLHGVFVGSHAIAEGALTIRQLREGPYVRVLHGVYADPSLPRDHLLRCRAAALLMPGGAALGGRSAAALLGAPAPSYGDPVTVVVPGPLRWAGPAGVRVHRTDLQDHEVGLAVDDLPVTSPLRTAWDLAVLETLPTAVGVLDAMLSTRVVTAEQLRQVLDRSAGRWGLRRVRRALDHVDGRSESPPESWVRVACAQAGLPAPVPQYEVVHDGRWLGRVDLAWPAHRVIVEYDGEHHFDDLQIVKDDARLGRLVAAGWTVIRLSAADLRSMDAVVRRIGEALGVSTTRR
ncbi:endonuclease domain-containing protein [Geodermatophilus sp. CPCC 206100]|uniref:endonuclease domain-containing protein n=1 Tax=Geodermatophilus sp. CPCC 206100 TaxID=3020054 RepID=UPI003B008FB1